MKSVRHCGCANTSSAHSFHLHVSRLNSLDKYASKPTFLPTPCFMAQPFLSEFSLPIIVIPYHLNIQKCCSLGKKKTKKFQSYLTFLCVQRHDGGRRVGGRGRGRWTEGKIVENQVRQDFKKLKIRMKLTPPPPHSRSRPRSSDSRSSCADPAMVTLQ